MAVISKLADLDRGLGDLARPTQFDVQLVLKGGDVNPDISLSAKATSFPGSQLSVPNITYQGQTLNLKGQLKQDTSWSCTFHLTENHDLKLFFEEWMSLSSNNGIQVTKDSRTSVLSSDFYNSFIIYQYPLDGSKNQYTKYTLFNVFPKSISKLTLDHSSTGQTLSFDVEFHMSHYEVEQYEGKNQSKHMDKVTEALNKAVDKVLDKIMPNKKLDMSALAEKTKKGVAKTKKVSKMVNPLL